MHRRPRPASAETSLADASRRYVPRVLTSTFRLEPMRHDFQAALLFADMAGFTKLTEKLARVGAEGAEAIARVLNGYLGRLVDTVLAHGGDVVKFAGDAMLAIWPTARDGEDLADLTILAAQCALEAQRLFAVHSESSEEKLSMRIGIGAGAVSALALGGVSGRWELMVNGPGVSSSSDAEGSAPLGEVVLSPAAWELASARCKGEAIPAGGMHLRQVVEPVELPGPVSDAAVAPAVARGLLPEAVLYRLEAGQTTWLAELRCITSLFINLPDFEYPTDLVRAQAALQRVQSAIYGYEGTINKINVDNKGQSVIGVFGLPPAAHEEDPLRGVLAALEVKDQLERMGCACSIGVATGQAFCGEAGSDRRLEYTILGDVVNLSARLMQAAHGGILCDPATSRAAQSRIGFEERDPIKLKGKAQAVQVFVPLGESRGSVRRTRSVFGREAEVAVLERRIDTLASRREGGVLLLEGDAGIGKSKLLDLVAERARDARIPILKGSGDSLMRSTLYHAWSSIFTSIFGLEHVAATPQARHEHVLGVLSAEDLPVDLAPLLNTVLRLELPETPRTARMDGRARADNTRELLLDILRALARRGPALLILDDVHWLDELSFALLLAVPRHAPELLLVAGSRLPPYLPETERARLAALPGAERLTLEGLPAADVQAMLCERLDVESLPPQALAFITDRASGHPFYSEELAVNLRESGYLEIHGRECRLAQGVADLRALDVPDTIRGILTSRIDRLPAPQQMLIKVASVVGAEFDVGVLREVHPSVTTPEELEEHLDALEHAGIAVLDPASATPRYRFKHAILQEAIYSLLTFSQRRSLHREVARWYETTHRSRLGPYYAVLAHHWRWAEDAPRAAGYLDLAGDQALASFSNEEAVRFFVEARGLDPESEDRLRHARRARRLGSALYRLGRFAESIEASQRALSLLGWAFPDTDAKLKLDLTRQIGVAVWHLYGPSAAPESRPAAPEHEAEATRSYYCLLQSFFNQNRLLHYYYANLCMLNLALRSAPTRELAEGLAFMGFTTGLLHLDRFSDTFFARARELTAPAEQLNARPVAMMMSSLHYLGRGRIDRSRELSLVGREAATAVGDRRLFMECTAMLAWSLYHSGDIAGAREKWLEVFEAALRTGDPAPRIWSSSGQAECALRLGGEERLRDAAALLESALEAGKGTGVMEHIRLRGNLALLRLRLDEPEAARALADQTAADIRGLRMSVKGSTLEGYAATAQVYLELHENKPLQAECEASVQALAGFAKSFPVGLARALLLEGVWRWHKGERAKAQSLWSRSLEESVSRRMPYEEALARAYIARLVPEKEEHRARAAELFRQMALAPPWGARGL